MSAVSMVLSLYFGLHACGGSKLIRRFRLRLVFRKVARRAWGRRDLWAGSQGLAGKEGAKRGGLGGEEWGWLSSCFPARACTGW